MAWLAWACSGQLFAALGQAAADQHDLLELWQIGLPGVGEAAQVLAFGQSGIDLRQLLLAALLMVFQLLQLLLARAGLLLGLVTGFALFGQVLVQACDVALSGEGLAQAWSVFALQGLLLAQMLAGGLEGLLQGIDMLLQIALLALLLVDIRLHRGQLRGQVLLAMELVALGRQALQALQVDALLGQLLPRLLGSLQGSAGLMVLGLQALLFFEPGVLLFEQALARLVGLELLLGQFQFLVEGGAGFGVHR